MADVNKPGRTDQQVQSIKVLAEGKLKKGF
jgi:hypothetical protein